MKKIIFFRLSLVMLCFFLFVPGSLNAHDLETHDIEFQFNEADYYILGTNIVFNGIIGGFSMMDAHNIPLKYFYKSHYFREGFYQGATGGAFNYLGKKCMTFGVEDPRYLGGCKLVSDFGTSLTYSATKGENYFENPRLVTDFGPFIFDIAQSNHYRPKLYIWPSSVLSTIHFLNEGAKFDSELSLYTLTPVYRNMPSDYQGFSGNFPEGSIAAYSMSNNIFLNDSYIKSTSLSHEVIHTRQHFQGIVFQPILERELLEIDKFNDLYYQYRMNDWQVKIALAPEIYLLGINFSNEVFYPNFSDYKQRPQEYEAYNIYPRNSY